MKCVSFENYKPNTNCLGVALVTSSLCLGSVYGQLSGTQRVSATIAAAETEENSAIAAEDIQARELLKSHVFEMVKRANLQGSELSAFIDLLMASNEWQHEICDSGPVENSSRVIELLYEIWKSDKSLVDRPIDRAMATACALEGAQQNNGVNALIQRYEFYRNGWKNGLLNIVYKDLSVFERRFLAKGVQHTRLNTLESMHYLNEEVCLPIEKYTGACWYAAYQLHNPFGDSIHGADYYRHYEGSYGSFAETIRNVGGVCGSLSNFGAGAAISNGVPAVTMGEPGHCAYAVMTKPGHWQPAYSLSWERGLHTSFHGKTWSWHMMNAKSQESWPKTKFSGDQRRLAENYLKSADTKKAISTIREARKSLPAEWKNWQSSIEILNKTNASESEWQDLHQDVLAHLSPVSGEIAYKVLEENIYPRVLPEGKKNLSKRRDILLAYQRSVSDWGDARWDYGRALNSQLNFLKGEDKYKDAYLSQVFGLHAKNNVFTPLIIETAFSAIGADEARKRQLIAGLARSLNNGSGGDMALVVDSMAAKVLPDAAKAGDKASFQYIGKLTAKNYPATELKTEPFSGILLSSGGTFGIQSPGNRWDNPARHWGVIETHGGDFHTNTQPATATVQLGNFGKLSGVNIVTRDSHYNRLVGAVLQTSIDGKEWTDVHTFTEAKRNHHIDLSRKQIDAGYVRVMQPDHGSIHFHIFHVYGKKQN